MNFLLPFHMQGNMGKGLERATGVRGPAHPNVRKPVTLNVCVLVCVAATTVCASMALGGGCQRGCCVVVGADIPYGMQSNTLTHVERW